MKKINADPTTILFAWLSDKANNLAVTVSYPVCGNCDKRGNLCPINWWMDASSTACSQHQME